MIRCPKWSTSGAAANIYSILGICSRGSSRAAVTKTTSSLAVPSLGSWRHRCYFYTAYWLLFQSGVVSTGPKRESRTNRVYEAYISGSLQTPLRMACSTICCTCNTLHIMLGKLMTWRRGKWVARWSESINGLGKESIKNWNLKLPG